LQNLIPIHKQEAISKFGNHYVIIPSGNSYGYLIKEVLGHGGEDLFSSADFYKTVQDAAIQMLIKIKKDSEKVLQHYENISKPFSAKWTLFSYHKGWLNSKRTQAVSNNLKQQATAKKNSQIKNIDLFQLENSEVLIEQLPDIMYMPETYIERNKEYYQFIHSYSMQHQLRLITFKSIGFSFNVNENSVINIDSYLINTEDSTTTKQISSTELMQFNGDYLTFDYANCYLFFDKEKCRKFVRSKIEEEIKDLQKILDTFN
jgi:hypothetical protein